ncbi:oxamate amidohydrolase proenzyme-like [Ostrinia nubilalis]|uniref:oxamate amidohydrolase proenzyme-like n=1 Tax=Ostrinia nubilalis TaxID=29057 RepID=UPI0030826404
MERSNRASRGMVVTPHHLASQSAINILREGGTAMEATVAAAATLAVVYPHMNSIGGDGFWLIVPPHGEPVVIEACGAAGSLATEEYFKGYDAVPVSGPKSAITVAGTVAGWHEALNYVTENGYQRISVSRLLTDAIYYAEHGFPVSVSLARYLERFVNTQSVSDDFKSVFLPDGKLPEVGDKFCQPVLAKTLKSLARNSLTSFYKGEVADSIIADMKLLDIPITIDDLKNYSAVRKKPISIVHECGEIFNTSPPTQGLVSLSILGILDRLRIKGTNEGQFIHATVEATKQAFDLRNKHITDPKYMEVDSDFLLASFNIESMAKRINPDQANQISNGKGSGDTVWLGVMDDKGYSVSFIQSVYHPFGSGVVLPRTGIVWHNRGISYSLDRYHILSLKPGKKPLHTLNPAAAILNDGRIMVYGTRGGDGQPQTQAAVFHRYAVQGLGLQKSVSAPRWVYGETLKKGGDKLSLENRFDEETISYLRDRGHKIRMLEAYDEMVGQAGALVRHANGMMEGAFDPRSDGSAAGF